MSTKSPPDWPKTLAFFAIGGYSQPPYSDKNEDCGLYLLELDLDKPKFRFLDKNRNVHNISYGCVFGDKYYCVTEGNETSTLHRFNIRYFIAHSDDHAIEERSPGLVLEQKLDIDIPGACYVSCISDGKSNAQPAVAFYDAGAAKIFSSNTEKGILEGLSDKHEIKLQHYADKNSKRQNAPHSHCIIPWKGKSGCYALVDLGADRIYQVCS